MTYSMHDQALRALAGTGPELRNGAPNHAPMVVEALAALRRDDAVLDWIDSNRAQLIRTPKTKGVIGEDWAAALGDFGAVGQWENLFLRELADSPWIEVLEFWLPRLIPGSMAAGTHGIIRCGHAVRALETKVTGPRLNELACALAYCAARYRTTWAPPALIGDLELEPAARNLPLLSPDVDRRGPPPKIVKLLDDRPDFDAAVAQLAPPTDPLQSLGDLAELGACLYLRDASRHPLVLLHAVTGPAALQLVLKHASSELRAAAFAYMWQAIAAWASAFSTGLSSDLPDMTERSWDRIIDSAVQTGDAHAVKFTEACMRLDATRSSSIFVAAADDWVRRLVASRQWSAQALYDAGITTRLPVGAVHAVTEPEQ